MKELYDHNHMKGIFLSEYLLDPIFLDFSLLVFAFL
jgi:hypothetical protein